MPPVYVKACARSRWHLHLWKKDDPLAKQKFIPFKCHSWRHEGECREWCGACDYRRCEHAMKKFRHWSFLVLTYPHAPGADPFPLFKGALKHWDKLRKRLIQKFTTGRGKNRKRPAFRYIQTWEVTKKGVPHANVAISCKPMFDLIADQGAWLADSKRKLGMRWHWYDLPTSFKGSWLERAQVECGFGPVSTLEPMNDPERLAGYMLKLARELTGSGVKSQIPIDAPLHFRRLRASRGTLPPRKTQDEWSGRLVMAPTPELQPIPERYRSVIDYSSGVAQLVHS